MTDNARKLSAEEREQWKVVLSGLPERSQGLHEELTLNALHDLDVADREIIKYAQDVQHWKTAKREAERGYNADRGAWHIKRAELKEQLAEAQAKIIELEAINDRILEHKVEVWEKQITEAQATAHAKTLEREHWHQRALEAEAKLQHMTESRDFWKQMVKDEVANRNGSMPVEGVDGPKRITD